MLYRNLLFNVIISQLKTNINIEMLNIIQKNVIKPFFLIIITYMLVIKILLHTQIPQQMF